MSDQIAIAECHKCHKQMAIGSTFCPHCGAKQKSAKGGGGCVGKILLAVIGVVVLGFIINLADDGNAANRSSTGNTTTASRAASVERSSATSSPTDTPVPPTPTPSPEQIKADAVEIEYRDLFRNVEQHVGKTIKFSGEIIQNSEQTVLFGDSYRVFRIRLDSDMSDVIWSEYHGEERFLEDDAVTVWGKVEGIKSYTTVMNAKVEIPSVTIQLIELDEG